MDIASQITAENFAWKHRYGSAYYITDDNGTVHTIFEYTIPYPRDADNELVYRYALSDSERNKFYQGLAAAIQNQFNITRMLSASNTASILSFNQVQTVKQKDTTQIYLACEEVVPITKSLLHGQISSLSALDIILRLATIIRDLSKLNPPILHRGLDIEEVYLNKSNKILLGGFFYSCPQSGNSPSYLCDQPDTIRYCQEAKEAATARDIKMLSAIAWGIFSGLSPGSVPPDGLLVYPKYAPEEIAKTIAYGLSGNADVFVFRKQLLDCRRKMIRSEIPNEVISLMDKYTSKLSLQTQTETDSEMSDPSPEQESSEKDSSNTDKGGNQNEFV